jgi:phosphatidylserine/phosphatidylglycerophosphate/cardiolipin synthase-like enzyme
VTTPAPPAAPFDWDALGQYKAAGVLLAGYPSNMRTFYSPVDKVHEVLVALIGSARHSVVLNLFGYDDDELDALIRSKMLDSGVYVQMSLDSSQAAGVHEKAILAKWPIDSFGTSVAVGQSIKHAISHLKIAIVDGIFVARGSTNWSLSGEQAQDNELTLVNDPVVAAETRAILDVNHTEILKQMAAKLKVGVPQ